MKIHTNPLPIAFALVLSLCLVPSNAPAAFLNWGDFDGDTVTFKNVTEDNGEATTLFAPASGPSVAGDMLILDPQGFQSQSNNGADLIDSTLSTRIVAKEGNSITSVFINEFGDYSLGGLSNGEAFASVGAAFFWRVLSVDGSPVALPTQTAQLNVSGGGFYERPGDDGTAIPWSGSTFLDVGAYLSQAGINGVATAISLRFDNTLQTAADNFSNAFIKKKGVDITIVPGPGPDGDPEIPEPTTALLLIIGTVAAGTMRRAC